MLHNLESQGMFIKMNNITYALRKKNQKQMVYFMEQDTFMGCSIVRYKSKTCD